MFKKRKIIIPTIILLMVLSAFLGHRINYRNSCLNLNFEFINPDISCGEKPVVSKKAYAGLKRKIVSLIDQKTKDGIVTNVSIYFRDLQNGPTLGIDEHTKFTPASLLKLPLLITYLSIAEEDPKILTTELRYEGNNLYMDESNQFYKPTNTIHTGIMYTVQQLLEYMIEYSDNKSYYVLSQYLKNLFPDRDLLKETYVDLGIIDPKTLLDETISVKSYASMFVQLYHSSFLREKESSEEALKILSKSDWKDGLVKGVPKGIKVANKFGERFGFNNNVKQLHDCGIIYYPGNPYLLCVMTQGYHFDELADVISDISKMTYEEFDSRKL